MNRKAKNIGFCSTEASMTPILRRCLVRRAEIERMVPCLKGQPKKPKSDAASDNKSVATEATGDAS